MPALRSACKNSGSPRIGFVAGRSVSGPCGLRLCPCVGLCRCVGLCGCVGDQCCPVRVPCRVVRSWFSYQLSRIGAVPRTTVGVWLSFGLVCFLAAYQSLERMFSVGLMKPASFPRGATGVSHIWSGMPTESHISGQPEDNG